jgi:hypothetical protein
MSLFAALKSSENGGSLYTISRLCLFQAGALLAQHYTTCLTTINTARKCQCRKRSHFIASNMSLFAALQSSENGGSLYTISRLCLFQAGALLAQHYTTCLTTVNTARKCQCRKRSQFSTVVVAAIVSARCLRNVVYQYLLVACCCSGNAYTCLAYCAVLPACYSSFSIAVPEAVQYNADNSCFECKHSEHCNRSSST